MTRGKSEVDERRRSGWSVILLALVLFTGCAQPTRSLPPMASLLQGSHLLYSRAEPYKSLYVEVDAVEGSEFSDEDLGRFRVFLGEWCDKPGGIQVVRSSVIPRAVARGRSADSLARRYVEGPPAAAPEVQPAFIYVLVYDNRIHRNALQSPAGAKLWPLKQELSPRLSRQENPHVNAFPYPAMIYFDRSWLGGLLPDRYWRETLFHETAHILGLVSRDSRAGGPHCTTRWCLMGRMSHNVRSDLARWMKRQEPHPELCEACETELRESRNSNQAAPRTRFVGPVMVREASSYRVLSLPGSCGLFIGGLADAEITRFLEASRSFAEGQGTFWTAHANGESERDAIMQAIGEARKDLDPHVRWAAGKLEESIRKPAKGGEDRSR